MPAPGLSPVPTGLAQILASILWSSTWAGSTRPGQDPGHQGCNTGRPYLHHRFNNVQSPGSLQYHSASLAQASRNASFLVLARMSPNVHTDVCRVSALHAVTPPGQIGGECADKAFFWGRRELFRRPSTQILLRLFLAHCPDLAYPARFSRFGPLDQSKYVLPHYDGLLLSASLTHAGSQANPAVAYTSTMCGDVSPEASSLDRLQIGWLPRHSRSCFSYCPVKSHQQNTLLCQNCCRIVVCWSWPHCPPKSTSSEKKPAAYSPRPNPAGRMRSVGSKRNCWEHNSQCMKVVLKARL